MKSIHPLTWQSVCSPHGSLCRRRWPSRKALGTFQTDPSQSTPLQVLRRDGEKTSAIRNGNLLSAWPMLDEFG